MCRLTWGGTAGLAAITLALAGASSAAAARGWRQPITLGPGAFAQVEQDASGRATAIWLQDNEVRASTRVGGTWSRPVSISADADSPNLPRLAVSPSGIAIAVWERREGFDYIAQAAVRPSAGAAWQPPHDLSASSQSWPMDVDVAVDSHGNAFAIWHRFEDPDQFVESAFLPVATGIWQAPQAVGSGTATRIAMDAAGNAYAVWTSDPGVVQAAVRPAAADSWLPPQTLSDQGYVFSVFPQISADAAGNAVAAWWRMRSDQTVALESAYRTASTGVWGSAQTVLTTPAFGFVPGISDVHVALAPGGNAVAIWRRFDGTGWIQGAFRPAASSTWTAPQDLSQPGLLDPEATLAVDASGNALALWSRDRDQIQAAFRAAGSGSWSLPQAIAGSPGDVRGPDVAFDAAGNAVAVWHRWAPSGSTATVESNAFLEPGAPPPPPPPPPAGTCRVPQVVGKKVATARKAIIRANCSVGRVRRARSRRVARGRVLGQSPRAGKIVKRATRVNLVVSRGRR